jgi:type VI secretion system secreted protein Hcp
MKEVFITSVSNSAHQSGEFMESVSMSYGEIDFSYKAQDAKGAMGGEVKFGWNVKTTKIT